MQVTRLEMSGLRCFQHASMAPAPGLNLITGDNGAGKTSVLEALHLMAYGRSFRGRVRDGLVRQGAAAAEIFVQWREDSGDRERKAGLRHSGQDWEGRLDGQPLSQLGDLCAALSVVTFEPGSHALVMGPADNRRRYLDWGLFHVEQDFLALWRRYSRALKQRNALLKARVRDNQLDAWEQELQETGTLLTARREQYLTELTPCLQEITAELLPAAGATSLQFLPGWRRDEVSLADALLLSRNRDLMTGFTSVGPHRADWRIEHAAIPGREALSRGQAKLTALSALLAQAEHQAGSLREWPVVALDDLASELDRTHQARVLQRLQDSGAQVFLTGTEPPPGLENRKIELQTFHVEQNKIHPGTAT